jgi:capsular polysaccharide export protein
VTDGAAGEGIPRRLFVYSGGFLRQRRLRRILALAGHELRLGWPGRGDGVAVWGRRGPAARGAGEGAPARGARVS